MGGGGEGGGLGGCRCLCQLSVIIMSIRKLQLNFGSSSSCQLSGCMFNNLEKAFNGLKLSSWPLLWRIQSNLSTTATWGTNDSGRLRDMVIMGRWAGMWYDTCFCNDTTIFFYKKRNAGFDIYIHNILLKHINKTDTKQKQRPTTRATDQVCDLYTKKLTRCSVYTVRQSFINSPLSRGYF